MRTFLSLILLLLVIATPTLADERQALQEENFLLKSELRLARTGKLYMLVDLPNRAILIKGGGTIIWRLPLIRGDISGPVPPPRVRRLVAKKSLFTPKRPAEPIAGEGNGQDKTVKIDAMVMELKDMPDNYRLALDDGTILVVEPEQVDWRGRLGLFWSRSLGWCRRAYHRLRPWGPEAEKSEVLLSLAGTDARRFYWSFDFRTSCLMKTTPGEP